MDRRRRRFVPGSEGLEGRMVLSAAVEAVAAAPTAELVSTALASPATAAQQVTSTDADPAPVEARTIAADSATADAEQRQAPTDPRNRPLTPAQEQAREELIRTRMQRIDRLPAFLQLLDPGRPLPEEAVATIQQELRGFIAQLRAPAEPIVEGFVDVLRDAIAQSSVKPETVTTLNFASGRLLGSAGVSEASAGRITGAMTELARTASGSNRPVVVMTNDYALVLQTAMGVGRPIGRADLMNAPVPQASFGASSALGRRAF